jgi:hypothetical protein
VSAAAPAPTQGAELIEFRGYAYTRTKSEISGGLITRYDPTTPQIWRVPYRNEVQASVTVRVPKGGYFVAPGHADLVASKLDLHGIAYRRLTAAFQPTEVEVFRADGARFSTAPFEGRMRVTLTGKWEAEEQGIPAGALFVPVAQPLVRLVLALLEPQAPDSFAAWGFFNAWFEQKEHLEAYVAEPLAREMLSADPQLAAEFQRQLAENPAFAASPAARLEFFHRRHASWDRQFNLYPIFRSENSPP